MKTLKILMILSFVQFIACTSFGAVNTKSKQDNAIKLLHPDEFAATADSSALEAELILQSVVENTINISQKASFEIIDRRIEALLNAAHAANSKARVNLYEHLSFLKRQSFKPNYKRVIAKIKSSDRKKAQKIAAELNSVI